MWSAATKDRALHTHIFFNKHTLTLHNRSISLPPFFVAARLFSPSTFHSPMVNSHSHCRLWVGSIWRSLCLSWVQLSFSHVYIMVRLAALSGQSGVLIQQPVQRNAIRSSALKSSPFFMSISHTVVIRLLVFSISLWCSHKTTTDGITLNYIYNIPHYS